MSIDLRAFQPKTFKEAVNYLYDNLTEEEREGLKDPHAANSLHHGPMRAVRNEWGLWTGSDLRTFFMEIYGLGHADDMSGLIQDSLLAKINGKNFNDGEQAAFYRKYWRDAGIDPLTQEKL